MYFLKKRVMEHQIQKSVKTQRLSTIWLYHTAITREKWGIFFFRKLWEFCLRHSLMLHWPQNNLYDKPHHLAVAYSSESELEKVEGYVRWLGTRRSRDFHFLYPYLLLENWDRRLKRQARLTRRGRSRTPQPQESDMWLLRLGGG